MTATWKSIHQSVLANKPLKEFKLRQYLFSAKARLLFRLNRPAEVVDRGHKFIQDFSKIISDHESTAGFHSSLREVRQRHPYPLIQRRFLPGVGVQCLPLSGVDRREILRHA